MTLEELKDKLKHQPPAKISRDAPDALEQLRRHEQATEPFVKTNRLNDTERAMLMGGACAKAYGWSPKKA